MNTSQHKWAFELWNRRVPIGSRVQVEHDNGEIVETITRSEAWLLGSGDPVVKVNGISGCYSLYRILPIQS